MVFELKRDESLERFSVLKKAAMVFIDKDIADKQSVQPFPMTPVYKVLKDCTNQPEIKLLGGAQKRKACELSPLPTWATPKDEGVHMPHEKVVVQENPFIVRTPSPASVCSRTTTPVPMVVNPQNGNLFPTLSPTATPMQLGIPYMHSSVPAKLMNVAAFGLPYSGMGSKILFQPQLSTDLLRSFHPSPQLTQQFQVSPKEAKVETIKQSKIVIKKEEQVTNEEQDDDEYVPSPEKNLPRTTKKKYTLAEVKEALVCLSNAVNEKGRSNVRMTARKFGIPPESLRRFWNQVKDAPHTTRLENIKTMNMPLTGNQKKRYFNEAQEQEIAIAIRKAKDEGEEFTIDRITEFASEKAKQFGHKHAKCGRRWVDGFLRRNAKVLKQPDGFKKTYTTTKKESTLDLNKIKSEHDPKQIEL